MNWVLSFHFTFAVFYATRADFYLQSGFELKEMESSMSDNYF